MKFKTAPTNRPLKISTVLRMIRELTAAKPGEKERPVFAPGAVHAPGKPTLCGQGGDVATRTNPTTCHACIDILTDPRAALARALRAYTASRA